MNPLEVSRRGFVGGALAAAVASSVREQSELAAVEGGAPDQLFWGDLHNHNAVGW